MTSWCSLMNVASISVDQGWRYQTAGWLSSWYGLWRAWPSPGLLLPALAWGLLGLGSDLGRGLGLSDRLRADRRLGGGFYRSHDIPCGLGHATPGLEPTRSRQPRPPAAASACRPRSRSRAVFTGTDGRPLRAFINRKSILLASILTRTKGWMRTRSDRLIPSPERSPTNFACWASSKWSSHSQIRRCAPASTEARRQAPRTARRAPPRDASLRTPRRYDPACSSASQFSHVPISFIGVFSGHRAMHADGVQSPLYAPAHSVRPGEPP